MLPSNVLSYMLYVCKDQCRDVRELVLCALYDSKHMISCNRHGLCKEWFKNGVLSSAFNYMNGKKHGLCQGWYEDGTMGYEGNYVDGKEGASRGWYEDGSLRFEEIR